MKRLLILLLPAFAPLATAALAETWQGWANQPTAGRVWPLPGYVSELPTTRYPWPPSRHAPVVRVNHLLHNVPKDVGDDIKKVCAQSWPASPFTQGWCVDRRAEEWIRTNPEAAAKADHPADLTTPGVLTEPGLLDQPKANSPAPGEE